MRDESTSAVEACWLATDVGLYCVSPEVGQHLRWAWGEIELRPAKRRRRISRASIRVGADIFEISLGTAATANLLAIYAWSQRPVAVDEQGAERSGPGSEVGEQDIVALGREIAQQDGDAFNAARLAVEVWLREFPEVAGELPAARAPSGVEGPTPACEPRIVSLRDLLSLRVRRHPW